MGEVYRARDPKLGRDVAIKVLPAAVTSDPNRLSRFTREARLLASLNHPNIGAIYEVEDAGGVQGLVLELIDGPALSDRLSRGALPIREALGIARQIATALEAAHEKGIIHRDLKPANIKITPAGAVKVIDFGIARGVEPDVSAAATETGFIIGTAAYMSPEQARGGSVDKRTDIWAFGCVLYEMLTGQQPFDADTSSDTIARILEHEPAWDRLPSTVPRGIQKLLKRCLNKDPADRLHDIADATAGNRRRAMPIRRRGSIKRRPARDRGKRWLWIALAAAAAVDVSMIWWALSRPIRTHAAGAARGIRRAISRQSHSQRTVWRFRPMDVTSPWVFSQTRPRFGCTHSSRPRLGPLLAPKTRQFPFWSADGSRLGFSAGGKLATIDVAGGSCDRHL